ncbi:MAG: hypothetical protein CFE40_06250 [Burkholderiales bacterium PBB1]|nr:MAG: hypothetical protein CFE40_06250 [Burkholderiales bacterium PBB1]
MTGPFAERLPDAAGKGSIRVWLKSSAYTRRLLLGAAGDPWASGAQYLAYFSQAHGLLKPDVAVLEVGELYDAWHAAQPGALVASLGNRRKPVTALRKLLETEAPRQLLAEVVEAVLANLRGQTPLVLSVPSPRRWANHANRLTGSTDIEVTADDAEDASMYLTDLIRSVSAFPISGVLLEEGRDADFNLEDLSRYTSIVNVVRHYRWSLALRLPHDAVPAAEVLRDFDAVISPTLEAAGAAVWGCDISAAFAAGGAIEPLQGRQFYFAEIDAGLRPESVLETMGRLRGG